MEKKIVIPFGFEEREIYETDVRRVQTSNLKNMSTDDGKLIDAILSFFINHCMVISGKT